MLVELLGGKILTDRITSWARDNISLEGIYNSCHRNRHHRKYEHTIFTNLRDRIHHRKFLDNLLFQEIEKYLPHLQNLVRRKIICEYNL